MNERKRMRQPVFWGIIWTVTALAIAVVLVVPPVVAQGKQAESEQALGLFEQVYRFIQENYVDEVDPDQLIEGALRGMFDSLEDPHSAYLSVDEMRGLTDTTSGEFGGVGMFISKPFVDGEAGEYIEIVSPIEDTPAYRAGLRSGDLIIEVSGESTADLSVDAVVDLLRGRPGTEVDIIVLRGVDLEFPVTLERATIRVPTVKMDMIGSIAFLRIIQFTPYTDDRVRDAIRYFEDNDYRSMIIDLRSNPGGLLNGVVDVADLFFSGGLIVETRGRVSGENQTFRANASVEVPDDKPIVVLIDDGSASAAEILAAALKDRDRALLMGQTSYGKGSVQQVRSLGEAGFRLTMARYYTPSGANIDKIGVDPHVVIEEPELSEDEQDSFARLQREKQIHDFVLETNDPSDREVNAFIDGLRADGIVLNDRFLRRLVRIEVNRVLNRTEVYDLAYDIVLQRAVEELRNR